METTADERREDMVLVEGECYGCGDKLPPGTSVVMVPAAEVIVGRAQTEGLGVRLGGVRLVPVPEDAGTFVCTACQHRHTGPELAGICIGCPCEHVGGLREGRPT
jgi:hypothetical protein